MADNLDIAIRVRADLQSALNNLSKMQKGVGGLSGEMRKTSKAASLLNSTIGKFVAGDLIARGAVGIARAVKRLAVETVAAGTEMESLAASMRAAVGGDAALAARELSFVARQAERLGIDLPTAERGFVKLSAAARGTALEGEQTRQIFLGVAEASRAMGLSAEAQSGALRAIEQIISKGVVSAEELRGQLGERLPGVFHIAARAAGATTEEFSKMLARGEVLAEDLLPNLARELREFYGAGAVDAASTPDAAFRRLDNAILVLKRTIAGSGITDFFAGLADQITDMIALIRRAGENIGIFDEGAPLNARDRQIRLNTAQQDYGKAQRRLDRNAGGIGRAESVLRSHGATIDGLARRLLREAEAGVDTFRTDRLLAINQANPEARWAAAFLNEVDRLREGMQEARTAIGRLTRPAETSRRPTQPPADEGTSQGGTGAAGPQSTAAREAARLERSLTASRSLTHEERIRDELAAGRLQGSREEVQLLYEAARALDEYIAAEKQRKDLADQAREDAAAQAAAERQVAEARTRLLDAEASLAGPYDTALRAAEMWRAAQLAAFAEAGDGAEEYGERVEAVYRGMVADAARDAADAEAAAAERRLRDATDFASGVERALRDLGREYNDFAATAESAVKGAFRAAEDALTQFVTAGKLSFRSLTDSIIADLARMAIQRNITGPLYSALESLFAPGASAASVPGPHVGHTGMIAGALGGVRRTGVPAYAFAGAPRLHAGGLASDEVPAILRRGEGVFTPEQMRALSPRPTQVVVNIENRTGTPIRQPDVQPRFDADGLVVGIVLEDLGRNGPIAQGLQQRFAIAGRAG